MLKTLAGVACAALIVMGAQSARADWIRGCTSFTTDTCYLVKHHHHRAALIADPGVALPAPGTYIIARGKFFKPELDACGGAARAFRVTKLIATRRVCR